MCNVDFLLPHGIFRRGNNDYDYEKYEVYAASRCVFFFFLFRGFSYEYSGVKSLTCLLFMVSYAGKAPLFWPSKPLKLVVTTNIATPLQ